MVCHKLPRQQAGHAEALHSKDHPQTSKNDEDEGSPSNMRSSSSPHGLRRQSTPDGHKKACSTSNLMYTIFFALLLLWTGLSFWMAQVFLANVSGDIDGNVTHGSHKAVSPSNDELFLTLLVKKLTSSVFRFFNPKTDETHQWKPEDDYKLIFYSLLVLNILTMLPSWCKTLLHKRNNHRLQKQTIQPPNPQEDQDLQNPQEAGHPDHPTLQTQPSQQSLIHHKLLYQIYLPPYLLATSADWLQGPYKYALYSSYGYTQRDIAHLFVAGYGSGMVLGSMVGGLADVYGRKKLCLGYCLAYGLSVMMKHCRWYWVLMFGRVCGGVATSLLFSCFESWLIRAHGERGLGRGTDDKANGKEEEKWLAKSLSMGMYGSSLVAIGSGVLANFVVESSGEMRPLNLFGKVGEQASGIGESLFYFGGYISAFDVALVPLVTCATLISLLWEENYGEAITERVEHKVEVTPLKRRHSSGYLKKHSSIFVDDKREPNEGNDGLHTMESQQLLEGSSEPCTTHNKINGAQNSRFMFSALWNASKTVWTTPDILACCVIGSFFEGAMYIFIFLWTPALTTVERMLNNNGVLENMPNESEVDDHSGLPFGIIFSTFMVCCMLGTMFFSYLSNAGVSASKCLVGILALSSLSSIAMGYPYHPNGHTATSGAQTLKYFGMLLYEFCIGAYYPAMGTVKGTIVPEDQRAAIYNVFRLPLNLFVLLNLAGDFSVTASFYTNAFLLLVACALQVRIGKNGALC